MQTFIDQEENNYSLFKYINGLSEELEKLDLEKKKIMGHIEQTQQAESGDKTAKESKVEEMKEEIAQSRQQQEQLIGIQRKITSQLELL